MVIVSSSGAVHATQMCIFFNMSKITPNYSVILIVIVMLCVLSMSW